MLPPLPHFLPACVLLAAFSAPTLGEETALMPRPADHTSMWWKEGFPGRVEGAPWLRCIQTGSYAFALDTKSLKVPFFGALPPGIAYGQQDGGLWVTLPAADLALRLTVDGTSYRATAGGAWSKFAGPRLIESGRFFQRADVTDLVFTADDGRTLNTEARFETAAWPDRLALILAARPGVQPITTGEASFGRIGGGFGLDGTNHLDVPAFPKLDAASFTIEFWTYVPADFKATRASPWLLCRNNHEHARGHFGIVVRNDGIVQARLNIGGGRDDAFATEASAKRPLKREAWNHLALSYDGDTLRLSVNGQEAGEKKIGRKRLPAPGGMSFGRRHDNFGDGYHFRGVVDEIRFYDRALTLPEIRARYAKPEREAPSLDPVASWPFRSNGRPATTRPRQQWKKAAMEIELSTAKGVLQQRWELPKNHPWPASKWREVSLAFDPVAFKSVDATSPVAVQASAFATNTPRPVEYDPSLGWHRINLDGIEPIAPLGTTAPSNDALERVKLVLSNPSDREQIARLMFEKTARGIHQRIGSPITGLSAILRDAEGNPTGIPVQLSKNWHNDPAGGVYAGQWFHGISQVRLPPSSTTELELTIAYGHWGGVAAASHAQLSLIGWGSNQHWDESALGSWGESICFEPDQVQGRCAITDVRPLMVRSMGSGEPWGWTGNVGGGDFFRFFDAAGERVPPAAMRTTYHRQGPCLTEVTYAGLTGDSLVHSSTVSLARSDDLVRAVYRLRLDVSEATDFSRFVVFQIGADTYSSTAERAMAIGNESGLLREWKTQWGGDTYRFDPMEWTGQARWASLHEAAPRANQKPGALANRGIVIRDWKARLGGKEVNPWIAERGLNRHPDDSSTLDVLPPPGVTRLEAGDFVEATIEHLVVPQFARDYYGPNRELQEALRQHENTWRMIQREATGNQRTVEITTGTVAHLHPDVRIQTDQGAARLRLTGGLGYVPLTFTGLSSSRGHELLIDGRPLNQGFHGNDFWQTDYDPLTRTWSRTYNVPIKDGAPLEIDFRSTSPSGPSKP